MTVRNQEHRFPPDELETDEIEILDQHICVQNWFFPTTVCIERSIYETDVEAASTPTRLNFVPESILEVSPSIRNSLDTSLFGDDAKQMTPSTKSTSDGLDRALIDFFVFEYVVKRKVITDRIKRAGKSSLDDCSLAQEPNAKIHIMGTILSFMNGSLVGVDGKNDGPNVFPLVQVATTTTPTVQNLVASSNPLLDHFAFALIVKFAKRVHFT